LMVTLAGFTRLYGRLFMVIQASSYFKPFRLVT